MNNTERFVSLVQSIITSIRKFCWPIEGNENKKFIPMLLILVLITFNYVALNAIKNALIVTQIGVEQLGFLKGFVGYPALVIFAVIYCIMSIVINQRKIFYIITFLFLFFFALFTFVLYPNPNLTHLSKGTINVIYPNFQWFTKFSGNWSLPIFYILSSMWYPIMGALLFWQFANQITKTNEAKRFYPLLVLLPLAAQIPIASIAYKYILFSTELRSILSLIIINCIIIIILYSWMNKNIIIGQKLDILTKSNDNLENNITCLKTLKYLSLLSIMVVCYGILTSLLTAIWKAKIAKRHLTADEYIPFITKLGMYQGFAIIFFTIIGSYFFKKTSWLSSALFTPVMLLITSAIFFFSIMNQEFFCVKMATLFRTDPLTIIVILGAIQQTLHNSVGVLFFYSTKEMAYIPIGNKAKTMGKALVDVIFAYFAFSCGNIIQVIIFTISPSYTYDNATLYFALICLLFIILWIIAIFCLNKDYNERLGSNSKYDLKAID
ncbi:Npt1/Npt2 family nucleotide transporter [Rickettsiaceae bacterium]|nr:Npt1/Npt2 family nucleotide transporter [Rickettsiaceae bacterium]